VICCILTADRAKQIKTTATVNEDPTEKLIRELQEQNAKLLEKLKAVESGQTIKIDDDDDDDDDDDGKLSDEGQFFKIVYSFFCLFV